MQNAECIMQNVFVISGVLLLMRHARLKYVGLRHDAADQVGSSPRRTISALRRRNAGDGVP